MSNDPWGQCERRGLNFLVRARSAARLLGGSAGSAGCQLTGPVAETPDVDLRRSAASHHQAELGGRCPGGAEVNSIFFVKKLPARNFLANNVLLVAGCDHELIHPRCFGRFRTAEEGLMQRASKLRYELRVSCV